MLSRSRLGPRSAVLALVAVLAAAPARAADAELDRFLPADTEIFVRINIRQLLDSKLVKDHLDQVRDYLKQVDELNTALKDLDFDPFKDIDSITTAAPNSNEQDRGLIIVRGKFKLERFKAKGEDLAKNMADVVKLHKVGDGAGGQVNLYEVHIPGQDQVLFVALPNETTLVASAGKDYVADAIKRSSAKDPVALKNKDFQTLLEKLNPKHTLAMAGLGEALASGGDDLAKDILAKLDAVGGGITVEDDIKIELVATAKTPQNAKELKETVNDGVTKGLLIVGLLAMQEPKLNPVLDVLKSVRCTAKEKTLTLKAEVSAEVVDAIRKALSGLLGQ